MKAKTIIITQGGKTASLSREAVTKLKAALGLGKNGTLDEVAQALQKAADDVVAAGDDVVAPKGGPEIALGKDIPGGGYKQ